jgi:hypothetical protein
MSAEDERSGTGRDSDAETGENGQTQIGSGQSGDKQKSGSKSGAGGEVDVKAEPKT